MNRNKEIQLYIYEKLTEYGYADLREIIKASKKANDIVSTREAYVMYSHIIWVAKMKYIHNHPDEQFGSPKIEYTKKQYGELKKHINSIFRERRKRI